MEERCPICAGFSIKWDGIRGCYRCLNRECGHTWTYWENGPKNYEEINNKWLKLSLPPGGPVPYSTR